MEYPKISVIVAVYNSEEYIETCLRSLLRQTYPGEIEIIVADGMSKDKTREIVEAIQANNPIVTMIDNPDRTQAHGRNLAVKQSTAQLIAYIDAHSYAEDNWLEVLHKTYAELKEKDDKIAGVGSIYRDAENTTFTRAAEVAQRSLLTGATGGVFQNRKEVGKVTNAYACLYDKNIIEEEGLYDTRFKIGEDIELNNRLTKKAKYHLYVNPEAITYYYRRKTLGKTLEQQFNYGFWRVKVLSKVKEFRMKVITPGLFLLTQLFLMLFIIIDLNAFYALLAFWALYLIIVVFYSLGVSITRNCNPIILVAIFPAIHYGYGAGVLKGIFTAEMKPESDESD